jgi:succinate dehydrogenase / fumarate reductase cytochrome b subunit
LSGVIPLGAFLIIHVAVNARALRGDAAFASAERAFHRWFALALVEWLFLWGPLLFHAAFGLWLVVARRPLAEPSPYPAAMRIAMRATGVAAIAFLAVHVPELRFRTVDGGPAGAELATILAADLSSTWHGVPWRGAAYLVGAGCVTFHFAAGLWGFFVTTRGAHAARERRRAGWAAAAIGGVIGVLLANVVVFYATGSRLFGGPEESRGSQAIEPCPLGDGGVR